MDIPGLHRGFAWQMWGPSVSIKIPACFTPSVFICLTDGETMAHILEHREADIKTAEHR